MRKIVRLVSTMLMTFCLFGCAEKKEASIFIPETQREELYLELDGYVHLYYDVIADSTSDKRILIGSRFYDDVIIEELTRDEENIVLKVYNDIGHQYEIVVGFYPLWTATNAEPLVGEKGRIFFEYLDFKDALVGSLYPFGKIELVSGEIYESSAFAVTPKEFRDWIAVNGEKVQLSDWESSDSIYVMVKVLAKNVLHSEEDAKVIFDACEKAEVGFNIIPFTIAYDDCPGSEELTEGNGITMYGYVDEGVFFPVYMEPTEIDFSLDDIVMDTENDW